VVSSTFARQPWLALPLVLGLLLAFGTLVWRLHGLAFGVPDNAPAASVQASTLPMLTHLALVFVAGIWLPGPLVAWFRNVALLLG
jgi:hydrogenase-4 component F